METPYALGPFRLDAEAGILFRGSEPVSLGFRAVEEALVGHASRSWASSQA
jgi:hypothetical protein